MDNFLRMRASPGSSAALYRSCNTMSVPGTQLLQPNAADMCGSLACSASSSSASAAAAADNAAAAGAASSFHHSVMHGGSILARPSPPPGPGVFNGAGLLYRHGFVGHPMAAPGMGLPSHHHHSATGAPGGPHHHLLASSFVNTAHSGQMNALTLAERLAGKCHVVNLPSVSTEFRHNRDCE